MRGRRLVEEGRVGSGQSTEAILEELDRLPSGWHRSGTVGPRCLRALVRHAGPRPLADTVETGCGKTTAVLSHLSRRHRVFTEDHDGSVTAVRALPCFAAETVEFVMGPTQRTLPLQRFDGRLELVLLDGPHAFPFVELEYWHLYPHLVAGGLLVVDDIHIPTIHHLFDFLREDEMFRLVEVVEKTAFFRRTDAPTFDPYGEGWWLQRYNARRFPRTAHLALRDKLLAHIPERVAARLRRLLGRT
jgi:hypothetical protein